MSLHCKTVFDQINCDVINDLRVWNTQRYSRKVNFEDNVDKKKRKNFLLI